MAHPVDHEGVLVDGNGGELAAFGRNKFLLPDGGDGAYSYHCGLGRSPLDGKKRPAPALHKQTT